MLIRILALAAVGPLLLLAACSSSDDNAATTTTKASQTTSASGGTAQPQVGITVTAVDFSLSPATITASAGQVINVTFKNNGSCIAGTDSNGWRNPPYDSAAFPTANNAPWLYICYDTQGTRTSTRATAPAKGDSTYSGKDLLVVLLARYGLFGGLSSEYLVAGASLTSIPLISYQHFAVQG